MFFFFLVSFGMKYLILKHFYIIFGAIQYTGIINKFVFCCIYYNNNNNIHSQIAVSVMLIIIIIIQ